MSDLQCASRLILARHGEAEYESHLLADEGGSLTRLGRQQASALGDRLAGSKVSHVYTSTLARAVQTGEIAAARLGVGVTTRSALVEFGCGELAGQPMADDPFGHYFRQWLEGDLDVRCPGAETGREGISRFASAAQEIADLHRGETVLVVSHGGLLRLSVPQVVRMAGIEPRRIGNCDTIEVDVDGDGWDCRAW